MKIEKVKSRKYKNTQYYKYRIIIPEENLEIAGFKEGDELQSEVKKGEINLRKRNKKGGAREKPKKGRDDLYVKGKSWLDVVEREKLI